MEQRLQALPVKTEHVTRIQADLETLRDHHFSPHGREAALIALGQSEAAEDVPIPDYIRNLSSARDAACNHAEMTEVTLLDHK